MKANERSPEHRPLCRSHCPFLLHRSLFDEHCPTLYTNQPSPVACSRRQRSPQSSPLRGQRCRFSLRHSLPTARQSHLSRSCCLDASSRYVSAQREPLQGAMDVSHTGFYMAFQRARYSTAQFSVQMTLCPTTATPNQALERTAPRVTPAAPPPSPAQPSRQPPPSLSLGSLGP